MKVRRKRLKVRPAISFFRRMAGAVTCALLLAAGAAVYGQAAPSDEAQIDSLLTKYRQSVDTLDPALITEIWSSDLPVSFIHPLGTDEGLDQIRSDIFGTIMGMFSKRDLLFDTTTIHVHGDCAWVEITWTFHAVWKDSGEPVTTNGRESQVLIREDGKWHIVHVHYSGPPTKIVKKGV
jgi:ketosteroid isomerase-like protein